MLFYLCGLFIIQHLVTAESHLDVEVSSTSGKDIMNLACQQSSSGFDAILLIVVVLPQSHTQAGFFGTNNYHQGDSQRTI